jgi:citrate lyase subunit beta/citryl-CoA lyase
MTIPRSYLFVPGDRPERFDKALASGADEIIIDLEDAVAPQAKAAARAHVAEWLAGHGKGRTICLRVNGAQTEWHDADMGLTASPTIGAVMLPKAESATTLMDVKKRLQASQRLIALIESVAGILSLRAIAHSGAVERIAFGSVDFCTDAGMQDRFGALDSIRAAIALESRFARLEAPIDGVSTALDDAETLATDVARARALGFGAKLCIHPKQVAIVNRGFLPSAQEREWALKVVEAIERQPHGAVAVDGKLIDKPLVEQARLILAQPAA